MAAESLATSLKRAFIWHWHLLGLGTIATFAVLTGPAAVAWVPLVAAAELSYLGFLGLNPRFQNVLRGRELVEADKGSKLDPMEQMRKMQSFLVREDQERFDALQKRCRDLLNLRRHMDSQSVGSGDAKFRAESLDRLLWLFLKLLHQRSGLERFLSSSNRASMEWELSSVEDQLKKLKEKDQAAGGAEGRITASVQENAATIRGRLENYDKAAENREIVAADLAKTEQQIIHICEVGMTMRDSAGLSAQIDGISASLRSSETAFNVPDLENLLSDTEAPPLLSGRMVAE
jgi:hypothetical protein